MTQTTTSCTAICKVIYDGTNNRLRLTSPSGKFIVFTPIWIGVSRSTQEFFSRCEAAHQWKRHGMDFQEFTAVLPLEVMQDCFNIANSKTDTVEITQAA
jgi:hypothetical protein